MFEFFLISILIRQLIIKIYLSLINIISKLEYNWDIFYPNLWYMKSPISCQKLVLRINQRMNRKTFFISLTVWHFFIGDVSPRVYCLPFFHLRRITINFIWVNF